MSKANERQVDGTHYKNEGIPDHWDIVAALEWDYFIGAATKYLWRLGKKGDQHRTLMDLDKSIHFLQKKRELLVASMQHEACKGYVKQD